MARIAIYGAGGFGRELLKPLQYIVSLKDGPYAPDYEIVFVDDHKVATRVCDVDVLGLHELEMGDRYVIAVGRGEARERLEQECEARALAAFNLHALSSRIGPEVEIAPGAVFCDHTMVTASAKIGRQFQCNIYSYVAHDCVIGDYVTFAPRVSCNGNVSIGDYAYIGTGAVLMPGVRIGHGATVGMGAVVTKDIPDGVTVMGNPAKPKS